MSSITDLTYMKTSGLQCFCNFFGNFFRETDEIGTQGQRDSGRRIGERITDTTFWRNEVNNENIICYTHFLVYNANIAIVLRPMWQII